MMLGCVDPGSRAERRPRIPTLDERSRMLQAEDMASLIVSVIGQPERSLIEQIVVRPSNS